MLEKEAKIKIIHCRVCGKEYNKYTRPWGARSTCFAECQKVQKAELLEKLQKNREIKRQKRKQNLVILLIICVITGFIGAGVGGYIFSAMGMIGSPGLVILIGFLVGFFVPVFIYLNLA